MFSRFAGSAARAAARRTATASKSYSTAGASPLKTAKKSSDVVWLVSRRDTQAAKRGGEIEAFLLITYLFSQKLGWLRRRVWPDHLVRFWVGGVFPLVAPSRCLRELTIYISVYSYLTSPPHKADPHHSADAKPSFKKKEPAAVKQEQEETEAEEPQPEEEEAAAAAAPATESEPEQKDGEDKSAAVKSDSGEMSPTEEESKDTDGPTPEAIRSGVQVAKTSHQSTPKSVGEAAKASVQEVSHRFAFISGPKP